MSFTKFENGIGSDLEYRPFGIDLSKLPRRSQHRIDGIKQLLDIAKSMEYELLKVDYHSGMIKLEWGAVALNWYTTTFTITVETPPKRDERCARQQHYKNLRFEQAKEIFENPLKFRKR